MNRRRAGPAVFRPNGLPALPMILAKSSLTDLPVDHE